MTRARAPLLGTVLACTVLVAAVTLGLLGLHRAAERRLDEALGQRLQAAANALAVSADADSVEALVFNSGGYAWADSQAHRWARLARRSDLAEITMVTPEGRVLVTTATNLLSGETSDFWALDEAAVATVRDSMAAVAVPTQRVGLVYQASAFAPVVVDDPAVGRFVQAVVTVRGNPDFYDALDTLRRGAAVTMAVVLGVVALVLVVLLRLERSVRRARASLARQESLAAMGRMTAGIAHEIRNPLGIIRGAGQHLQRVLAEAGIEDEVADFIPEEVDRLDRILTGYLAFGRDGDAADEVFTLESVLRRGVALAGRELEEAGVAVVRETDLDGAEVRGDPRRLQQVLLNLLLNARDAMPGGGAVRLAAAREGDTLVLTVSDEGDGAGRDARPVLRTVLDVQGEGRRAGTVPVPPHRRDHGRHAGPEGPRRPPRRRGRAAAAGPHGRRRRGGGPRSRDQGVTRWPGSWWWTTRRRWSRC